MGRIADPNRDKAYDLYKQSAGGMKLKDIAEQLGVSEGTVRGWKSKDDWDGKLNGTFEVEMYRNAPKSKERSRYKNDSQEDPDDSDELTDQQRIFVNEYLIDFNGTKAAIRAGYSENSAHVAAARQLRNDKVRAAINAVLQDREAIAEYARQRIISQLERIAFSDIRDFLDFEERGERKIIEVGDDGRTIERIHEVGGVRLRPSNMIDGTLISEVQETKDGIKFKRLDPMKAMELLMQYRGMIKTNINVKHAGEVKHIHEQHYHITQQIIEQQPNLIDVIFGADTGRGMADRGSPG